MTITFTLQGGDKREFPHIFKLEDTGTSFVIENKDDNREHWVGYSDVVRIEVLPF